MREELGVEIEIVGLLPKIFETVRSDWHALFLCYVCKLKDEDAQITLNNEASDYGWFTPEEIRKLLRYSNTDAVIEEIEKITM
jgi:ADP-ribose pyrophosphatase YjhB (NUDIX family)